MSQTIKSFIFLNSYKFHLISWSVFFILAIFNFIRNKYFAKAVEYNGISTKTNYHGNNEIEKARICNYLMLHKKFPFKYSKLSNPAMKYSFTSPKTKFNTLKKMKLNRCPNRFSYKLKLDSKENIIPIISTIRNVTNPQMLENELENSVILNDDIIVDNVKIEGYPSNSLIAKRFAFAIDEKENAKQVESKQKDYSNELNSSISNQKKEDSISEEIDIFRMIEKYL